MRWKWTFLSAFCLGFLGMKAQDPYAPQERMRFATVSLATGHLEEAWEESRQLLQIHSSFSPKADSLHYIAARAAYSLHLRDSALAHFASISDTAQPLVRWAHAALAGAAFHQGDTLALQHRIHLLRSQQDRFADYGALLQMAELLHDADTSQYRVMKQETPVRELYVRQALKGMDKCVAEFGQHKPKRPAVAGILSAALPGAGKAYLGRWGAGGVSLLGHAALGVQVWEGYRHGGVRSPQFIVMGSLLVLSYGANIYGTIIQTKAYNVKLVTDLRQGVGLEVDLAFDRLLR